MQLPCELRKLTNFDSAALLDKTQAGINNMLGNCKLTSPRPVDVGLKGNYNIYCLLS